MGDLLIQKTVPAEECERFANALTGRECRCDPSKLYTISVRAHGVAEQHQGEPVALPEHKQPRPQGDWTSPETYRENLGWNACLDEIAKLGPLYTHADPGEAERLRAQLHELALSIHKRHYAKTAPDFEPFDFASGLIGQVDNMVAGMLQDISTLRAQLAERDALLRKCVENEEGFSFDHALLGCIKSVLSASAEPSALVGDGLHDDTEAVRAALERKP